MSQSTIPQEQRSHSHPEPAESLPSSSLDEARRSSGREFDYRPVPVLAPVSLFLGLCSLTAWLWVFGVFLSFVGMIVGTVCLWIIRRNRGELGGRWLGQIGLALSVTMFATGFGVHRYRYVNEVPDGYHRVHFNREISKRDFVYENGVRKLHPEVAKFEGQKIFVKGFMWNVSKTEGLSSFLLLKDNGECCFGGDPQPRDMIWVEMQDGKKVDALLNRLISVAGVLRCDPNAPPGEAVYTLEATMMERSRTSF